MSVELSDRNLVLEQIIEVSGQPARHLSTEGVFKGRRKHGEDVWVLVQSWAGKIEFKCVQADDVLSPLRRTRYPKPSNDLQSGLIHRSTAACEKVAHDIRTVHQHLSPEDAVKTIGTIWESIEKTGQLAEARTRICLGKLKEPQLAERPAWLAEQLQDLSQADEDLAPSHPLAIEAADRVIRACLHLSMAGIEAKVQKAPLGNVLVDWDVEPHSLQWEVEAARLPWPGVKINALVVDNSGDKPQAHTRIFHTAFEVIDHFSEQLHEFDVQTGMH